MTIWTINWCSSFRIRIKGVVFNIRDLINAHIFWQVKYISVGTCFPENFIGTNILWVEFLIGTSRILFRPYSHNNHITFNKLSKFYFHIIVWLIYLFDRQAGKKCNHMTYNFIDENNFHWTWCCMSSICSLKASASMIGHASIGKGTKSIGFLGSDSVTISKGLWPIDLFRELLFANLAIDLISS